MFPEYRKEESQIWQKNGKENDGSYKYNDNGTVTIRKYLPMPNQEKNKQLSATGKTKREAKNNLMKKYNKIWKEGGKLKSNGYTVKSWLHHWLNDIMTDLKGGTYDNYYGYFNNYVYPTIGKIKLKDLRLSDIQKVVDKVKNTPFEKNGKIQKRCPKTIKNIISPLIQALNYAIDDKEMSDINFKRLRMPKVEKKTDENSPSRNPREEDEQEIVTKYFKNEIPNLPFDLYYAPILVMDLRGLRPEECAGLQWIDIDYEHDKLFVGNHTVVKIGTYDDNGKKTGEHLEIYDSTKTPAGKRIMPLGKILANLFKQKYQSYLDKGITPKPTDFIFINKVGNLYYDQSLRKMYKSLANKLGISEKGCYSLRHEFATSLSDQKCSNKTIMSLMGWKNMIYTYIHTDDPKQKNATQEIDSQYEKQEDVPLTLITNPTYCENEGKEVKTEPKINNIIPFPIQKIINQ